MNRTRLRRAANHYFPFLKKSRQTGWRGRIHRLLARIGPVTRSSPWRRTIQVIALAMFLVAFVYVCWPYSQHFDETLFSSKETYPVELFLLIDPLVGVSTALAGRIVNPATFVWTLAILAFCLLVPRAFCGYLCPLGTLIDAFDWLIGRRFQRWHLPENGPKGGWVHAKYYLLAAVLVTSLTGVLTAGFVAAIPVLTRGMLFTIGRVQLAWLKGIGHLPATDWTFYLSIGLFMAVFVPSLFGRRFWCRYLCPSGATLSVFNWFRIGERKVESTCIHCNRCVEICPFDAIREDFTTRTSDCTYCQSCGGVCPTGAIQFVTRWRTEDLKPSGDIPVQPRPVSRRAFVATSVLAASAAAVVRGVDSVSQRNCPAPIRPPGSVQEDLFLDLCIRCGQCFVVCPGPVLRPAGWEHGIESLWTPVADLDHAGCHQDCNHCTLVCPTGAIRPLDLAVKRTTHMGLAQVDTESCWPFRKTDRRECDLCFVECESAGYHAIEMREFRIELDPPPPEGMFSADELEQMSCIRAPVVDPDACVGCGICQYRCHTRFVLQEKTLPRSAIVVVPEDRNSPHRPD
ncbi:MAG: 4Fe-4S binding protein [Pirellulaceae bacterium]|nr:4Fe-4S binding protein [Pirellulaceae bacterium]